MFETIKEDLRQLRRGESGSRFCRFYDFRKQHRLPGISPVRVLNIFLGLLLLFGGASIGWLPGPGGFVAIFGLALLAQEFRPVAVALDWIEPKLRTAWKWLIRTWQRMSAFLHVAVTATIVVTSVGMGYAAYSLLMR